MVAEGLIDFEKPRTRLAAIEDMPKTVEREL
jgi:hypothetical protein